MTLYVNSDVHTRTWTTLATSEGITLSMAPGEEVELDGPISDPWLVPAKRRKPVEEAKRPGVTPETAEPSEPNKE